MADYKTSLPNVFSAGDMRRGQSLVVWAIREGRLCARAIDQYLMGIDDAAAVTAAIAGLTPARLLRTTSKDPAKIDGCAGQPTYAAIVWTPRRIAATSLDPDQCHRSSGGHHYPES